MENKNFAFGGITRSIGGAVCADGDLHTAVDVCNDGAGLQLLEKPRELFELENGETLLCIHEPEGEGKHYITQLVVPTTPVLGAGLRRIGQATAAEDIVVNGDILDGGGGGHGGGGGYSGGGGSSGYTEPSTSADNGDAWTSPALVTAYESVIAAESDAREQDDGGADANTEEVEHIYLRWRLDNGNGTSTVKQSIDITNFGKITAIQPMGNTLVCNHEGTDDYLPEVRYYLWKEDSEMVDGEPVDTSKYVGLGSKPPMLNITFGLESEFKYWPETKTTETGNNYPKKYKGTYITCYPYTDTVSVWWDTSLGTSYVPPFSRYGTSVPEHWSETYNIENVVSPDGKTDVAGIKINWTTAALGCYNKFIAEQNNRNKFVFPFYCRYAYELYDGSLVMHSYPVLMIPNSRGPIFALDGKYGLKADLDDPNETYEKVRLEFRGRTYGFSSTLLHEIAGMAEKDLKRLKNWKDLIRGVNIYITPPIYNYKQGGQVLGWHCMDKNASINSGENPWKKHYTVGKVKYTDITGDNPVVKYERGAVTLDAGFTTILKKELATNYTQIYTPWDTDTTVTPNVPYPTPDYCLTIPQKEEKEITELHENAGQFYKLATIEYETLIKRLDAMAVAGTPEGESELEIGKKVVNTISNQDVMQDDNGSHDTMSAEVLYGYNRRLNMANATKQMHTPLNPKVQWAREYYQTGVPAVTEDNLWQVNIYAKNGGRMAVMKTTADDVNVRWPLYVFYPNTDATEAVLIHGDVRYKVRLREHKALNGVFWLGDFYNKFDDLRDYKLNSLTGAQPGDYLTQNNVNRAVNESNKIYTTETDNPFYVPFGNINIAGGGEVRALAAATTAMSQGQFGQHPMYCFTSEGVWAMTVSDTGGWATIQPVTRDVITAGTKPLSLDSTVVFLGDRGLLQLGGAETTPLSGAVRSYDYSTFSKVASLSDATNMDDLLAAANSLLAFPDVAVLTYDARSGRIYVTPENVEASWVYNLKSGLWTQATTHIDHQVTTYPECEGQQGNMIVEIGGELGYQKDKGFVITRPVKFGDGSVLRRIHELAVRGQFRPYGPHTVQGTPVPGAIQTALWGTRDWVDHALVASSKGSRITRWGGSPYFGHCVGLFITQPADYLLHVVGVDAAIDMEHYNKLR